MNETTQTRPKKYLVYFTFMSAAKIQKESSMTAMEKSAWNEFVVAVTTIVNVSVLFPWLGDCASDAFGLLGFGPLC